MHLRELNQFRIQCASQWSSQTVAGCHQLSIILMPSFSEGDGGNECVKKGDRSGLKRFTFFWSLHVAQNKSSLFTSISARRYCDEGRHFSISQLKAWEPFLRKCQRQQDASSAALITTATGFPGAVKYSQSSPVSLPIEFFNLSFFYHSLFIIVCSCSLT